MRKTFSINDDLYLGMTVTVKHEESKLTLFTESIFSAAKICKNRDTREFQEFQCFNCAYNLKGNIAFSLQMTTITLNEI